MTPLLCALALGACVAAGAVRWWRRRTPRLSSGAPYRTSAAPTNGVPWRRRLIAWLFDGTHPRVESRRWAGGRWALLPVSPPGVDGPAIRAAYGERWWRSWSAECQQWTPVDACPHARMRCECEVNGEPAPRVGP